jgi:hypothetical protein
MFPSHARRRSSTSKRKRDDGQCTALCDYGWAAARAGMEGQEERGGSADGSESRRRGERRRRGSGNGNNDGPSGKRHSCCAADGPMVVDGEKAWNARRRDPRINGADIYVARVTKVGMGSARPCWRCVEWCRWAGVKRIFHWNGSDGKFDVVKVNAAKRDQYETHADVRLFAGMVRRSSIDGFVSDLMLVFSSGLVKASGDRVLLEPMT